MADVAGDRPAATTPLPADAAPPDATPAVPAPIAAELINALAAVALAGT